MRDFQVFRRSGLPRVVAIGYFGQVSSEPAVAITPRAGGPAGEVQRNRRQEETFRKVLAAGIEVLRTEGIPDRLAEVQGRKLLEKALESRRIFGTAPKFADVQEAVLGEPGPIVQVAGPCSV